MTAALAVDRIVKRYGTRCVLDDVSLTVRAGEIMGLIGLNGAGKTTLIRILLDLAQAERGGVALFGIGHRNACARARLAYLPERLQPSRFLSGWEFLALSLAGHRRPLDRGAAVALARRLRFDDAAFARRIVTYSKGMAQTLGLIAALLGETPLLILDEPMAGLDPRARVALREVLLACRGRGDAVLLTSHILTDLDQICDRVAVLHAGRLAYCGTPAAFKSAQAETSLERAFLAAIAAADRAAAAN